MNPFDKLDRRRKDFKSVFLATEEGERVLADIYKMCGMNNQIHTPGDEHDTSFKAGKHRIGQGIQSILGQDENDISTLVKLQGSGAGEIDKPYDPYNQSQ